MKLALLAEANSPRLVTDLVRVAFSSSLCRRPDVNVCVHNTGVQVFQVNRERSTTLTFI